MVATSCCMAGHPRGHCPKHGTFDAEAMCCGHRLKRPLYQILMFLCRNYFHNITIGCIMLIYLHYRSIIFKRNKM